MEANDLWDRRSGSRQSSRDLTGWMSRATTTSAFPTVAMSMRYGDVEFELLFESCYGQIPCSL